MDLSFRLGWEDSPLPLFQIKKQRKALKRGSWALSPVGGGSQPPLLSPRTSPPRLTWDSRPKVAGITTHRNQLRSPSGAVPVVTCPESEAHQWTIFNIGFPVSLIGRCPRPALHPPPFPPEPQLPGSTLALVPGPPRRRVSGPDAQITSDSSQ